MKENLFSSLLRRFKSEHLPQREQDFRFAMQSNGYFLRKNGEWRFSSDAVKPFLEEFKGEQVSFFGPERDYIFFSGYNTGQALQQQFMQALEQESVTDVIRKYREVDEKQAARIAYLFGVIVRHKAFQILYTHGDVDEIVSAVKFAAQKTMLGGPESGDAIASAISMYIISGGSLAQDNNFTRHIYQMSEAVREDPIKPLSTS